jgi:hypothetical protein
MNLVRWEPLNELVTLRQAMDRLFEDSFVRMPRPGDRVENVFAPAVDIVETPDKIGIKASMPGVKPDDIEINIDQNTLTIKGETKFRAGNRGRQLRPQGVPLRHVCPLHRASHRAQDRQGGGGHGERRADAGHTQGRGSQAADGQNQGQGRA